MFLLLIIQLADTHRPACLEESDILTYLCNTSEECEKIKKDHILKECLHTMNDDDENVPEDMHKWFDHISDDYPHYKYKDDITELPFDRFQEFMEDAEFVDQKYYYIVREVLQQPQ